MGQKVQEFFKKEDNFKQGITLTDDEINAAISLLGRDIHVLDKTVFYKEFLKTI